MKPLEIRIEKYLKEHAGKRIHPVAVAKKFNLFTHGAIVRLRRAGWLPIGDTGYYSYGEMILFQQGILWNTSV
jgi:hypothetical protein